MTSNAAGAPRILGALRAEDGKGAVRIEDRYDTTVDDLWSAITEPARLARWFGEVSGDLRPGGTFRWATPDLEAAGRIGACEAPRRLLVTSRETDESYERGNGVPPFDATIEATLTPDGDQTVLVIDVKGMPVDKAHFYGAGWQIHAENLAAYIAGREPDDVEARWAALVPEYEAVAPRPRRILGVLSEADGKGVVRMEDRYATDIDDLWNALTTPARLARWLGEIDGDLREGGEYHARYFQSGWEGTSRIEVCDPPHRLLVRSEDGTCEVTLTADGDHTLLVWEERGMPIEYLPAYGAGIQIHVEDLGTHVSGGEVDRDATKTRWEELEPLYEATRDGSA